MAPVGLGRIPGLAGVLFFVAAVRALTSILDMGSGIFVGIPRFRRLQPFLDRTEVHLGINPNEFEWKPK